MENMENGWEWPTFEVAEKPWKTRIYRHSRFWKFLNVLHAKGRKVDSTGQSQPVFWGLGARKSSKITGGRLERRGNLWVDLRGGQDPLFFFLFLHGFSERLRVILEMIQMDPNGIVNRYDLGDVFPILEHGKKAGAWQCLSKFGVFDSRPQGRCWHFTLRSKLDAMTKMSRPPELQEATLPSWNHGGFMVRILQYLSMLVHNHLNLLNN